MDQKVQDEIGNKLMIVVLFTLTISSASVLMLNFVIPEISREYSLTTAQVSWVTSAYGLIYGIGTVIYGKLADRFKLKNLLTFGLTLFALGSMIGFFSHTFGVLLAGRCLQALGGAAIPATAMLIPVRYFPPETRGSAMAKAYVGLALGGALGPILSAFIVSVAHWRWLFCVSLVILITLPFYRKYLGDEESSPGKLDWLGGGLLAAAVTLLLLGITNESLWFALGGLLVLVLFIIQIHTTAEPFVQPALFRNKNYSFGLTLIFLIGGIGFSFHFLSPLLLADVHQLPANWIGFVMVPAAAATAIMGKKGGKLADKRGNAYLFFIASFCLILSLILMSTFTANGLVWIAAFLVIGNVGQTYIMLAMSNSVSRTLSKEQSGVGMGFLAMTNFIAGSIATGIYGKVVDLGATINWNPANFATSGFVYSNIYLVLAFFHLGILLFYYFQFGRQKDARLQVSS